MFLFLASFGVTVLAMLALGIGLLMGGKPIEGSCTDCARRSAGSRPDARGACLAPSGKAGKCGTREIHE